MNFFCRRVWLLILCAGGVLAQQRLKGEGQECEQDCVASAGGARPPCVGLHQVV
jgi:hypothetical protein